MKGVKQLGSPGGNWLSADQSSAVVSRAFGTTLRAKPDYAMLAMLFGCGLRRSELVGLAMDEVQMRQGHSCRGVIQKLSFNPNCRLRGGAVPPACPKFGVLMRFSPIRKFVWLNTLNASARNCR